MSNSVTPWTAACQVLCSLLSHGSCSHSRPSSQWCHPTIFSSVVPFSSCLPFFPLSGSFPMNWLFASGGQSIGASASALASVLPMNSQAWFPAGLTSLISLQPKGLSRVFCSTTFQKHQFFSTQPSLWSYSHIHHIISRKMIALIYGTLLAKWTQCSLINLLAIAFLIVLFFIAFLLGFFFPSRYIMAFLPRNKCLLISWLQSMATVVLEPKKRKSVTFSTFY